MQDYEVGYKKPPQETRWKKGQSGNPGGRPKGAMNKKRDLTFSGTEFRKLFLEEGTKEITITENGVQTSVPKLRALMAQFYNKAMSGNIPAAKFIIQHGHSMANTEEEDMGMLYRHRIAEHEKSLKSLREEYGLSEEEAKEIVLYKLYKKFLQDKEIRTMFGEEVHPYAELEPRTESDWKKFKFYVDAELKSAKHCKEYEETKKS